MKQHNLFSKFIACVQLLSIAQAFDTDFVRKGKQKPQQRGKMSVGIWLDYVGIIGFGLRYSQAEFDRDKAYKLVDMLEDMLEVWLVYFSGQWSSLAQANPADRNKIRNVFRKEWDSRADDQNISQCLFNLLELIGYESTQRTQWLAKISAGYAHDASWKPKTAAWVRIARALEPLTLAHRLNLHADMVQVASTFSSFNAEERWQALFGPVGYPHSDDSHKIPNFIAVEQPKGSQLLVVEAYYPVARFLDAEFKDLAGDKASDTSAVIQRVQDAFKRREMVGYRELPECIDRMQAELENVKTEIWRPAFNAVRDKKREAETNRLVTQMEDLANGLTEEQRACLADVLLKGSSGKKPGKKPARQA